MSDFVKAGERAGLAVKHLGEWWHNSDLPHQPRLISFVFEKRDH